MALTYDSIASVVVSSNVSSINFTSIPTTFSDLKITGTVRGSTGDNVDLYWKFNNTGGGIYDQNLIRSVNGTRGNLNTWSNDFFWFESAISSTSNMITSISIDIPNYTSTSVWKNCYGKCSKAFTTTNPFIYRTACLWESTSAISSVDFTLGAGAQFTAGTVLTLFGIKAA